mmetsp:Transcript_13505/g.41722  ORF Transcript_13505/g.41722 Transcript_13505/m.41722 type:complete len:225 (-) Transcript_13505:938-1612(-)
MALIWASVAFESSSLAATRPRASSSARRSTSPPRISNSFSSGRGGSSGATSGAKCTVGDRALVVVPGSSAVASSFAGAPFAGAPLAGPPQSSPESSSSPPPGGRADGDVTIGATTFALRRSVRDERAIRRTRPRRQISGLTSASSPTVVARRGERRGRRAGKEGSYVGQETVAGLKSASLCRVARGVERAWSWRRRGRRLDARSLRRLTPARTKSTTASAEAPT